MEPATSPTLRDLYPNLTDAELQQAEENLERYLAVVLRIHERLETAAPLPAPDGTLG
jgi:hypothetical protein